MRPRLHFTAPKNWLNDPNGLVWHDGLWHLCYQHNPHGTDWGHLHWGHAVSRDLLSWEHWPHALNEDVEADLMAYSGSIVAARKDGRAPGSDRLAALFTGHRGGGADHWHEHVDLAWSDDGGRTFAYAPHNPVLRGTAKKFGDPKVWWDARYGAWFMANIAGWPDGGHVVFARSTDLMAWEICGEFRTDDQPEAVWECPDCFTLPVKSGGSVDILKVNTWVVATGAKTVRFFIGRFDGATFHADGPSSRGPTPVGDESYGEVSWGNVPAGDGRCVMHGWLPQKPHASRPYTGVLWLPRELTARRSTEGSIRLAYSPVRELAGWRSPVGATAESALGGAVTLASPASSGAVEWSLSLALGRHGRASIACSPVHRLVIDAGEQTITFERPGVRCAAHWMPSDAPLDVRILFDQSVIDVFAAGGTFATAAVFDDHIFDGSLAVEAGSTARLLSATGWSLNAPRS